MDTLKQLQKLQREIAQAVRELTDAVDSAASAEAVYYEELAKWHASNKDIVDAKSFAVARKNVSKQRLQELRTQASELLSGDKLENLPEGFAQKRSKVVTYDKQGFTRIAHQYFPFLLVLDEKAVESFFTGQAKEADDGALILPENIRAFASVEVEYAQKPEISEAKLAKLVFDDDDTKELPAVDEVVEIPAIKDEWTAPSNATALLTAAGIVTEKDYAPDWDKPILLGHSVHDNLPELENSSEDESLPLNTAFNGDGTWKNQALWEENEQAAEVVVTVHNYPSVPATDEINF